MPAQLSSNLQPNASLIKASTAQPEEPMCNEQGIADLQDLKVHVQQTSPGISNTSSKSPTASLQRSEKVPSAVPPCPTNWHQTPLEQTKSDDSHSSPDIPSPCSDYHDQHDDLDKGVRNFQGTKTSATEGGSHTILTCHESHDSSDKFHTPGRPQVQCTVNQESYEHQTGPLWRASMTQAPMVQGSSMLKTSNTTNVTLQAKRSLWSDTSMMENGVNSSVCPSSLYQDTGPSLQLNGERHWNSLQASKEIGKSMQVTKPSPVPTDTLSCLAATTIQTRPPSTSCIHAIADLPGQFQVQPANNAPGALGLVAQKRVGDPVPSMQAPRKKQKLNGDSLDQSFDQMNDVMAVSGVNLGEEEEKLLVEPSERSHTSKTLTGFVQDEERRPFLEKQPLHDKVTRLAKNCGILHVSEDVELCLSLLIEEWFRNILHKLIKFSKQRCDLEKGKQKILVTSDVGRQIYISNKKAKEALEAKEMAGQKQAGDNCNEQERATEDKAELQPKAQKAHKDDEKAKVGAAKIAARRAGGTEEMLIKWEIMAEQARLKRESQAGGSEGLAANKTSKLLCATGTQEQKRIYSNDNGAVRLVSKQKKSNLGMPTLAAGDSGRPPGSVPTGLRALAWKKEHCITVKDLIAVLEMEPRMAKSTLLYRLYNRNPARSSS